MKTVKELENDRVNLVARAEEIKALAKKEQRELTVKEKAELDGITDATAGKIAAVDAEIKAAKSGR